MTEEEIKELKDKQQAEAKENYIEKCKELDKLIAEAQKQKRLWELACEEVKAELKNYKELIKQVNDLKDELFDLNIKKKKSFKKLWKR